MRKLLAKIKPRVNFFLIQAFMEELNLKLIKLFQSV